MLVYDPRVVPLMEQFRSAHDAEGIAIKALLAYMESDGNDKSRLSELTDKMTAAHDVKMRIYEQMQSFRLDK